MCLPGEHTKAPKWETIFALLPETPPPFPKAHCEHTVLPDTPSPVCVQIKYNLILLTTNNDEQKYRVL